MFGAGQLLATAVVSAALLVAGATIIFCTVGVTHTDTLLCEAVSPVLSESHWDLMPDGWECPVRPVLITQ